VQHLRWTYWDDSHGNWTRRIPEQIGSVLNEFLYEFSEYDDVLRIIEYADE
jgi:hypothetical protein